VPLTSGLPVTVAIRPVRVHPRCLNGRCGVALTILSRDALYDLVWTEPIRTIAVRMGVSDVWLRMCCIGDNIPLPERGYWTRLHVGKPLSRCRLPLRAPGQPDQVRIDQPSHV
jgi:hypothetical protein